MKYPRRPLNARSARGALRAFLATASVALVLSWGFLPSIEASAGQLDAAFGAGGKVVTDFGRNESAVAIAMQRDMKIVVVGTAESKKKSNDFAVARYNPDGSLDPSFGSGGRTELDFFRGYDAATAVTGQPDGKIVVAGRASDAVHDYFALARFNTDGSLDESFGSNGQVTTRFFDMSNLSLALAIQPDGRIVLAGYALSSTGGTDLDFALIRFNQDGSLDESFGTDGKVVTDFFNHRDIIYSIAIQPDEKIVAAGYAELAESSGSRDFALARYDRDGSLDSSFGAGGLVTTDMLGDRDEAYALALAPDGKIVVAGYGESDATINDFALARYNPDGSLDSTFGSGGKVTTDFFGLLDSAFGVAIQANGRIVATGYAWTAWGSQYRDFAVARYESDGSLDTSFGSGGKTVTDFSGGEDWAFGVALTPNGRIVTAGYASGSAGVDFALACYQGDAVAPEITGAEVSGKKLYVYGKNFDDGAQLLMSGEEQKKTFNDELTPATMLIARKSGKNIAPGETVTLQVRNSDGNMSNQFSFTRPVQ